MNPEEISVVILCGGDSRRMGEDKASLIWRGQRLVDRKLDQFQGFHEVVISVRDEEQLADAGCSRLIDPERGQGPFCALAHALASVSGKWLFACAVDVPHMDAAALEAMAEAVEEHPDADAVLPVTADGRIHPLSALYRTSLREQAAAAYARGSRKILDFLQGSRIVYFPADRFPEGENTLRNLNRKEDL